MLIAEQNTQKFLKSSIQKVPVINVDEKLIYSGLDPVIITYLTPRGWFYIPIPKNL